MYEHTHTQRMFHWMQQPPMAVTRRAVLLALAFQLLPFLSANDFDDTSPSFPFQDIQSKWRNLDGKLATFLSDASGIETLQQAYDDAASSGEITFEPVDGRQLVKKIADSLGDLFAKRVQALQVAVEQAEKIAADYNYDKNLKPETVDCFYAKELNDTVEPFVEDELYGQIVNPENSSIHIPVDIFKGSIDILNAIAWTSGLDEVWKKNKAKDPSLVWQYFGSRTGVLRSYPATKWKNKTVVDLYDVRRSKWYTQGASSPKDMLILIERSGSAHGQALELIKHSVRSIIDTLGENDFVNIAHFSDKAQFAGCFHTFVQATDRNKQKVKSFLDSITAQQLANYALGFEFAFKEFANFSSLDDEDRGANCNRIIMLFTDGTSDVPVDVFQKYNPDKKIRIFSYAVGPTAGNRWSATKEIGCSNRGFFYPIPAMGAIRAGVQEYLNILSGGICAYDALPTSWSDLYDDIMDMGLVLAVTMPVFQKANASNNFNQTMLGMMGVDVTLKELEKEIPSEMLGPDGYAFIINSNGIVLLHPKLEKYSPDLTSPVIDFVEIEEETLEREQIRKEMIDQLTNSIEITDFVTGSDVKYADKKTRTYHYTAIPGTSFSVAVVIPKYVKYHVTNKQHVDFEDAIALLLTNDSLILSETTKICKIVYPEMNETFDDSLGSQSALDEFVEALLLNTSDCSVDDEAIQKLLFDVRITSSLEEKWSGKEPSRNIQKQRSVDPVMSEHVQEQEQDSTDLMTSERTQDREPDWSGVQTTVAIGADETTREPSGNSSNIRLERSAMQMTDGIQDRFVTTGKDFVRVYPQGYFTDEDRQTELISFVERMYKRSFDNDLWIFASYPEKTHIYQAASLIFASKTVSLKTNNYKAAAIGVTLTLEKFHDLMFHNDFSGCNSSDFNTYCYVLDDGGFILAADNGGFESSFQVGNFFGEVEGEVMDVLIDKGLYESHTDYDYMAICKDKIERSAGFRVVPPFIYEILSFNWWTTATTWSYLNLMNLYSWLLSSQVPYVESAEDRYEERACTKSSLQYHFGTSDSLSDEVGCHNCTRTFSASRLQSTNLLMVSIYGDNCNCKNITSPVDEESDYDPLITQDSSEANCTARVRYRRRPPCYDTNPYEPDSYCGASSIFVASRFHITLSVSVVLMKLFFVHSEGH